jgi:predicted O-methyltransferase YrrM
MALDFYPEKELALKALERMKQEGAVASDATLNLDAPGGLRKEVVYKDSDFEHVLRQYIQKDDSGKARAVASRNEIQRALAKMKQHKLVAPDASFNFKSISVKRTEVAWRDYDLLYCLGETQDEAIVDSAAGFLKEHGIIAPDAGYDKGQFERFRSGVKDAFEIRWTSFSQAMERLLYFLSSVKKPERNIGIGIFCGYTFIWNLGYAYLPENRSLGWEIFGVDIDGPSMDITRSNFESFGKPDGMSLLAEDGVEVARRLEGPFDYIYLDADSEETGKKLSLDLLEILYDKLSPGGWVLTHDTTGWEFQEDFKDYFQFVRDRSKFSESVLFHIDCYGVEMSIKNR